ncbi:hypothetical protein SEA_DALANDE_49 [Gordonia phage DalanDe]|nr:hypothetical protein SEA_DALANDE_49 [Gordonia phage DalanDe]
MIAENFVGVVAGQDDQGYYVEVFREGQYVRYGPMHYISPTGQPIDWEIGDRVFITTAFFRDQFVIMGKYIDVHTPFEPLGDETVPDPDGEGVVIIAGDTEGGP